ncbi:hypothetical protein I3842_01G069800 [Carya illinoinensis]|uniref:Uncharacterized protein n=1 Tax=Carya illinoinensis TaxID=32201 RepID=A0A922K638_CARIL|nr:hypothetical protein I3842_01G069800 [Carya illinoinensis]
MAEPPKETDEETAMIHEECKSDDGRHPKELSKTSFLAEMNLLLVFLSSLSSPDQELLNYEQRKGQSTRDHEAKACISRLRTKRQEISKVKLMGRPAPRFQTTVRDSSHGRRM